MTQTIDKNTIDIKQEFNSQFKSSISPKIKQFNKKRLILAIEGIISLIIPVAMAYIFFVMKHPATPKDFTTAVASIIVCGSVLPIISLYYYFCPDKIREEETIASNLLKFDFHKALYEHGESCSKQTNELEEQVLALFRIKKNHFISNVNQNLLINKLKSTMIFPKFDKITRFDARITLGGLFVLKNTNDIGAKYTSSRNGCKVKVRENSFYSNKPNDYYMVLLLGGFLVLITTICTCTDVNSIMTKVGFGLSFVLLISYIIMIFVNSADQYRGVIAEIETPEKIYDGHAVLIPANDKHLDIVKKALREVKSPAKGYSLLIDKTNHPSVLNEQFFELLENIKKNFKPEYLRASIKNNSIIIFMKTSSKRLNIFDWTKDMESSKAYEPFINRLVSLFNLAEHLSKKS